MGRPRLSACETRVEIISPENRIEGQFAWPASGVELGFLYERCVGLHYEALGYAVEYRGLSMGLLDGGIDLVASIEGKPSAFVQCKYGSKAHGRQRIEQILYKADQFFQKTPPIRGSRLVLAVPAISSSFSQKRKRTAAGAIKVTHPMADYFLAHNRMQNLLRLEILELQLEPVLRDSQGR